MIRVAGPEDMAAVLDIRARVFIAEQGVSEEEERDGRDGEAVHLIAFAGEQPVGTARILTVGTTGKIGRVAVLASERGTGIGKALIEACLVEIKAMGLETAKLGAQTHAIGFYEALGFAAEGPEYLDANIPHRDMLRTL
ncbi:MAG: GNAT family N-acetyltransferase [Silicimonas sp.]|nr:GNAT family N-acetyltransferase [Silicimonas sp.]